MSTAHEIEKNYEPSGFAAELRRLADAIESGEDFTLDIDGETITVPASALASVEFEQEDGTAELEFQLSWEVEDEGDDEESEAEDAEETEEEREDA